MSVAVTEIIRRQSTELGIMSDNLTRFDDDGQRRGPRREGAPSPSSLVHLLFD